MMKKLNKSLIVGLVLLVCFIVFTVLVKFVDVGGIGPLGSKIGFSSINGKVFSKLGESKLWFNISEILGILSLIIAGGFVILGLIELIKHKKLKLVDNHILALGVFYVVVAVCYAIFEIVVINKRPVLIDGNLEASYPSSHTMLAICIMGSAIIEFNRFFNQNKKLLITLDSLCVVLMVMAIISRLLSGMHWFTDILGGIIISASLIFIYNGILKLLENYSKKAE